MTHDPTQLAIKIGKYVQASRGCSYSDIKTRASERNIEPDVLEDALRVLHRLPQIHRTVAGGDVQYVWKEVVKKSVMAVSHVEWVRANYPPMTSANDGSGFDIDLSWLFLSPEELDKYKADVRGVVYIPKKRYRGSSRK